jgi:hypothetical protein
MAAAGCLWSLAPTQVAAAPADPGAPPPHALVLVAESILEKQHPAAADVVIRLATTAPGLTTGDHVRLHLLKAMVCQPASDDLCARKEINDALSQDRSAVCPPFASPQFQRLLEDARAVFPKMAPAVPVPAPDASRREPPVESLIKAFDALYAAQEFEGADIALQHARRYQPPPPAARSQLSLRRGILQMEVFDEAGARRSFQEALDLDRTARLPAYGSPSTLRLLEEARAALPPLAVEVASKPAPAPRRPPPPPPAPPRPWPWLVAGGGVALAGTGGALYLGARSSYDRLATRDPSIATAAQLQATADTGRALQTGAFVLVGVGAAAAVSGVALHFLGAPAGLTASIQVSPGGAGLGFAGVLP